MLDRLLVVTPLNVAGDPNARTHHLVRHLATHFRKTMVISRMSVTHSSSRDQWRALIRMQTVVWEEGKIRWINLSPLGNIRSGLGLHLLDLASPYTVPRWGIRRILRRVLSPLGGLLELGWFPSLFITYLIRIRGHIDVVIGEGPWEVLFGLLLRALGRTRLVIYDDIDYTPGTQLISGLRRRIIAALERFGIRHADLVISVGERLANLRRAQGARQVWVIPNGVVVKQFTITRNGNEVRSQSPTLVYMGYLGIWSGVDLVVDAASLAVQRMPNLRVILLGSGTPLDLLALQNKIREQGLEKVVEFRGQVPYYSLPAHLAEADIGLAMLRPMELTRYAFPLKVVEYMAAGLPVLTTVDTEAADLVLKTGAGMAVPFDTTAVANTITAMWQDSERYRRYSENAQNHSKAYDWEKLLNDYYAIIEQYYKPLFQSRGSS